MKLPYIADMVVYKNDNGVYEPAIVLAISGEKENITLDLHLVKPKLLSSYLKAVKQGNKVGEWQWPDMAEIEEYNRPINS